MRPRFRPPKGPDLIQLVLAAAAVLLTLSGRARAEEICRGRMECAAQELHKKTVVYPKGLKGLGPAMVNALPQVNVTSLVGWADGYLPSFCKSNANDQNLSPYDMQVFNVTYSDCDQPWIFCRHKDSRDSLEDLAIQFGRLPVRMRNYVRHIAFLPDPVPLPSGRKRVGRCHIVSGDISFYGPAQHPSNFKTWVHEVAHSMDNQGGGSSGLPFSFSIDWQDAVKKDTGVPDPYAQTKAQENFAENLVLAFYDSIVNKHGGWNRTNSTNEKFYLLQNQHYALMDKFAESLVPGGTCTRNIYRGVNLSDDIVCAGDKAVECNNHWQLASLTGLGGGPSGRRKLSQMSRLFKGSKSLFGKRHATHHDDGESNNNDIGQISILTLADVPANNIHTPEAITGTDI